MQTFATSEEEAMRLLLREFGTKLSAYTAYLLRSRAAGEDAAQEALVDLLLHLRRKKPVTGVKKLLLVFAKRRTIDAQRRQNSRWRRLLGLASQQAVSESAPELSGFDDATKAAFDALSDDMREIILLRFQADCSHRETAEILGLAEGTVKSRLARALAQMRTSIEGFPIGRPRTKQLDERIEELCDEPRS